MDADYQQFLRDTAETVDKMLCGWATPEDGGTVQVDQERLKTRFAEGAEKATRWHARFLAARQTSLNSTAQGDLLRDPTKPKHWAMFRRGHDCSTMDCYYALLAVIYNMVHRGTVPPIRAASWDNWHRRLSMQRQVSDAATKTGDAGFVFVSLVWGLISGQSDGYDRRLIERVLRHVVQDAIKNYQIKTRLASREPNGQERGVADEVGGSEQRKPRRSILSSIVPDLTFFDGVPDEGRFAILTIQAWIAAHHAAEKGLSRSQIEKLKCLFHAEYDVALVGLRRYLMRLPDLAERARWHDRFVAISDRTRTLFFESLDRGIADWPRFADLMREEREIGEAFHFDQGSWEFLVKDPSTGMLVPEGHKSALLTEAKQKPNGPGQAGEMAGAGAKTDIAEDSLANIVLRDFDQTVFDEIAGSSTRVGIEYLVSRLPGFRNAEHPDPKTVRSAVNRLCGLGLVEDTGGRDGIAITPKGEKRARAAEDDL